MYQTIFKIAKMDCPSEEQMIRLKLDGLSNVKSMQFDLQNRTLALTHTDSYLPIFERLEMLKFDTTFISTVPIHDFKISKQAKEEKKILWQVLGINFFFFLLEMMTGFFSRSMGLIADSLDMFADSIIYGLALMAVGGTILTKKNIAKVSGYLQMVLAGLGLVEVVRRFLGLGEMPNFKMMIFISILALIGNAACLYLLQKSKSKEAHMQATMIFTSNDVLVNIGVIVAGVFVFFTKSQFPDLLIGSIVFLLVVNGALKILKLSK